MSRIAIIGSGISGLAAAYYLSRKHTAFVFESESRLGGHTNTIAVETSRGPLPVDTGFIVHNDRTYPKLIKLLAELGVETQPSDMSFAVTCRETGFEYSSRGLRGFFAQRANLLRPLSYELFREILRFNRIAPRILDSPETSDLPLGDFLDEHRFRGAFLDYYLLPMASAIWSASHNAIRSFPAQTLVRFFSNHGMLGINTHPKWKAIRGGSQSYIAPLTAPYRERIYLDARISAIARNEAEVTLKFSDRPALTFDQVIFACNCDRVLPLLESPTDIERDVLQHFTTSRNEACLHTDSRLLPRRPEARASWNYNLHLLNGHSATVTYHMNRLQSLPAEEDYCVTLNANDSIDPAKVLHRMTYYHPQFTSRTVRAQSRWSEISGQNRTHFAGAYWFYGFHEDGLNSALRVARSLGVNS
ncbi:MAG: FAD-dependent oxidoreductase [Candidatus Acidiferrales bacterium]